MSGRPRAVCADPDRLARAHLSRVVEPGDQVLAEWLHEHGPVGLVERLDQGDAPERWLLRHRAIGAPTGDVMARAARIGIAVRTPADADWPAGLDDLASAGMAPAVCLWVRGRLPPVATVAGRPAPIAVVGSRDASAYGLDLAVAVASAVAAEGIPVISGAALGIDTAAHRGALAAVGGLDDAPRPDSPGSDSADLDGADLDGADLDGADLDGADPDSARRDGAVPDLPAGPARPVATVAVLGCGVDRAYPSSNTDLLGRVARHGAVVSELPPGAPPYPWRFPTRNRLIAAMAGTVVVVEAGLRSGAAGTARCAADLSRVVAAFPGEVHRAGSAGCHALIRDRVAELVTGPSDVLGLHAPLDGPGEPAARRGPEHIAADLAPDLAQVWRCLSSARPRQTADVATRAGVDTTTARASLLDLEVRGLTVHSAAGWRRAAGR